MIRWLAAAFALGGPALLCAQQSPPANGSLLFENLRRLASSYPVEDATVISSLRPGVEGPKGMAAADLDGDGRQDVVTGNQDGTVAVLFGRPSGGFEQAVFLPGGDPRGLRDVIAVDLLGDGRPEIVAANPFEGKIYLHALQGSSGRNFAAPLSLTTWPGARAVTGGDFDGDGKTDLAVAGAGEGFREYRGDGAGGFTAEPALIAATPWPGFVPGTSKPVFSMQRWRMAGESRDRLVLAHAASSIVWLLAQGTASGRLEIESTVTLLTGEYVFDVALGMISAESRASGLPDLLTASTFSGEVFIRRHQVQGNGAQYPVRPHWRLSAPGGPRAMALADVNADGWTDLMVASRNGDSLALFTNSGGELTLTSQVPAGASPRDVTAADFNNDGTPDAAVINRKSQDVTLHLTDPASGKFLMSPLVKRIPGTAWSLQLHDLNGDGRSEITWLTRGFSELNIAGINAAGVWEPVRRYDFSGPVMAASFPDLDLDGRPDIFVLTGQTTARAEWRLQRREGSFGSSQSLDVPGLSMDRGVPHTVLARDFDGDTHADVVLAQERTPRLWFLQGTASGLVLRRSIEVADGPARLAAGDFDQDGDLDLAALSAYGQIAIVENHGLWFDAGATASPMHMLSAPPLTGVQAFSVEDLDSSGDPELVATFADSVRVWRGGSGLFFEPEAPVAIARTLSTTDRDFEGDGSADVFALCPSNATATFFRNAESGWWYVPYVPYSVPPVYELASGDIDGDGRPDLAGAGAYLWAVLSGTPQPATTPAGIANVPPELTKPVINEILASTSEFVPAGANKPVDAVEIHNGSASEVDLTGWKLRLVAAPGDTQKPDFVFPSFTIPERGYAVIYATEKDEPWHAPFKLPAAGGTLRLLTPAGAESDAMTWPRQQADVAWARVADASTAQFFNGFPTIGSANFDPPNLEPSVNFKGMDAALLAQGRWHFRAEAWDDSYVRSVTISLRPLGGGFATVLPLFDDGRHGDGAAGDGAWAVEWAGEWGSPPAPGTALEFYITANDATFVSATEPDGPGFSAPGQPVTNYSLALPATPRGWEISEVVPHERDGVLNEYELLSEYVELRNVAPTSESTADVFLSDKLFGFGPAELFPLTNLGTTAGPGAVFMVLLDGQSDSGTNSLHAPFGIGGDGDSVYLIRLRPDGATELLESVHVPAIPGGAWTRLGVGGPWVNAPPTPGGPNAPAGGALHLRGNEAIVVFPAPATTALEGSSHLAGWETLTIRAPSPFEQAWHEPLTARRFFRLRSP